NRPSIIKNNEGLFQLIDDIQHTLQTKKAQRGLRIFDPYFQDSSQLTFKPDLTYVQLLELIDKLNHKLERKRLQTVDTDDEFTEFKQVVQRAISRPLKNEQEKASFFLATMKRAANFSVPGAGKTAMMYGTFAFLSSLNQDKVDKLLVISPLNAFAAWRTEYEKVFGPKRQLHYMNLRDNKYNNDPGAIKRDWVRANVITINYESLK